MLHDTPLDTSAHLAHQFTKVRKASPGEIVLSGLITPITRAFNCDLSPFKKISCNIMLDLEVCITMKIIIKE